MKTLPLGTTGVEVSALCLGAIYFGSRNDQKTSFQMQENLAALNISLNVDQMQRLTTARA